MARRIPETNGNLPPPSTLAAQIVQNQTRPAPRQNGETAAFSQLLHEILHNPAAAQESDLGVNVKLISVVAEAGLAPLAQENPFAADELVPQAIDSIAVIERTIKRQPDVLLTPMSEDGPQLALLLFAHLAALCGRPKCHDLPLAELVTTAIQTLRTSPALWQNAETVEQICQDLVEESVSDLEAWTSSNSSFSVKLPPAKSVAKLWPESENAITVPYGCQTSISSQAHAFMLALLLLNVPPLNPVWRHEVQSRLQELLWRLRPKLESSKQWEKAVRLLLQATCGASLLQTLLKDFVKRRPAMALERCVATALLDVLSQSDSLSKEILLPEMQSLAASEALGDFHEDLRITVTTWMTRFAPEEELPEHIIQLRDALRQDNVMVDGEVQALFKQLSVAHVPTTDGPRRRKRRRIAAETTALPGSVDCVREATRLLSGVEARDLVALPETAAIGYQALTEDQQSRAWQLLTMLAKDEPVAVLKTAAKLVQLPEWKASRRARVLSLAAIQAGIERTSDASLLDLARSTVGQTCLGGLHSSLRELRIASGRCLPFFLRAGLPNGLTEKNRRNALEYIRALSDRNVAGEHETLIGAWAQVALVCDDYELNLVLLRLVEYLGHPNPVVSAMAYTEVDKLAAVKQQSVEDLMRPFWGTVAVSVVQDLQSRPQKAQHLCDLLGMDVNKFLLLTEQHTIPTLVLTKRRDILLRILTARGNGSLHDLVLQPKTNLAATLALLLTQPVNDPEGAACECLAAIAPNFRGMDIANVIKMDPVLVACEMLKHSADAPTDKKSRIYHALQIFANMVERRPGQARAHSKANRALTEFLDTYILGIMAHFSQIVENLPGSQPMSEKIRSLKAVRDLVNLTKRHASNALPQLRACLQSAMEQSELCDLAFSIWMEMLAYLEPDDISQMLGPTFALVVRHWSSLPPEQHQLISDKLGELIRTHNKVVQEKVMILPSLAEIPLLSKYAAEIERLQSLESLESRFRAFEDRLRDESLSVVQLALRELVPFLIENQEYVHEAAVSEQPVPILSSLMRALLDVTTKYSPADTNVAELCGKALGIVGCLDPNRVEATRQQRHVLVLSNFEKAGEVVDWVVAMLEDVLVKAFKSATGSRAQGFLAFTMQEMLRFCSFNQELTMRTRSSQAPAVRDKWMSMSEQVRITLTPYLSSRYLITNVQAKAPNRAYPDFSMDADHGSWLRSLVYDLMWKAKGDNPKMVFPLIARLVRALDLSIAGFMLPYAVLNVVLGGTVSEIQGIGQELLAILQCEPTNSAQMETVKQCSLTVFGVLDYMSSWLQEKKRVLSQTRADAYKTGISPNDFDEATDTAQVEEIERFLAAIPAEALATRAVDCGSYARALFNWEQYIRQKRFIIPSPRLSQGEEQLYGRLHSIYACIDEPDGLEGIGAHLSFLTEEQQTVQHTRAGRWTAASAWYEMHLAEEPSDEQAQMSLLNCLRETGQYAPLLRYAQAFLKQEDAGSNKSILPLTVEAQWMSGDLAGLKQWNGDTKIAAPSVRDFSIGIGQLLATIAEKDHESLDFQLRSLRTGIAQSMTDSGTSSLQGCHDELKRFHALYEIEAISTRDETAINRFIEAADKRLAVLGSYNADKQYLLGVRRAVMQARNDTYSAADASPSWLTTARLARKAGNTHSAYNAVLQAFASGDHAAKLEEARLLWHDGHQRQAIHALESAISSGAFEASDTPMRDSDSSEQTDKQNMLVAKAHLLLAKWLDASGQSQAKDMTTRYQFAARNFQRWEKGHYYLGKHYNKLLEAERAVPKNKQSPQLLTGEMTKAVVENLMRSIPFGNKYWHETIPKILTLWLDLGMETLAKAPKEDHAIFDKRMKSLQAVNKQFHKYFERIPAYVFYTALPQMISRISHPHPEVWRQLSNILIRIISGHPSQAMWYMLPVSKATERARADRGAEILNKLKDPKRQLKSDGIELKTMIATSQKLSDALLLACEQPIEQRKSRVHLQKDLGFNVKLAPTSLVVPIEATLTVNLPTEANAERIRRHKAFAQDKITIQAFLDDVLVLSSLQRPRKITVRGSDGKLYGLLCKPKDDLRKDQRLMEFNGIINRALKRDAESSKRRLYIKTYAVTPLSEESGTLEWVEGIKPMRDILLNGYSRKGTRVDYAKIRDQLAEEDNGTVFTNDVLPQFPPILHEWFTETYSEPESWFAARLRYARSAAVMSMTGHVLGLGDRHGENILLEESTGGVFHVDFNCLFDKGKTFEKPELVPFRLTHNMVDAMGAYGHEGPFRKSSELTLGLLRQNRDTLMTVLETFVYDPTADFVSKKKRHFVGVPETPQEILDSVGAKLKGLYQGENVPLGVEGYVDVLIREAVSPKNLASMYIGWCAFF